MSNEVMTRNSEWMNHIVNHLNRMVDNFERAVMNYRPMLGGERFMTDKELCARLQLSRRTLQDYRNNGVIPYIQLGGKILYRESDIQKILMANYREAYRMKGLYEIEIRMLLVNVNIILVGHIVDPLGLVITFLQVIKIIIDQGTVELE